MNMTIIYFALIVAIASLLQASIGFGFPIVSMAFLTLLFSYTKSVALCQAIAVVSTSFLAIKYRKYIHWKSFLPLLLSTILISTIFTVISVSANSDVMFLILGIILVGISIYFMIFSNKIHIKPTFRNALLIGIFCGILSGLTAICGPLAALYLLSAYNDKKEYLACMQTLFALSNIVSIIIRISFGSLEMTDFRYVVIGWIAMAVGTILGLKVFKRLNNNVFKKVIYFFIGINGLWIVISHL